MDTPPDILALAYARAGPAQGTQDTYGKKFPPTVQYGLTELLRCS